MQGNLNNSYLAQSLFLNDCIRRTTNVAIVSEYNRLEVGWTSDLQRRAALWTGTGLGEISGTTSGTVFVAKNIDTIRVYSVYISPSIDFSLFCKYVDELVIDIKNFSLSTIVAGDFNSKSPMWGSSYSDRRGRYLAEALTELGILPTAVDPTPTFVRGASRSVIDFLAATRDIRTAVVEREVITAYNASDHRYLWHCIGQCTIPTSRSLRSWNARKVDLERLDEALRDSAGIIINSGLVETDDTVGVTMRAMIHSCDVSMPLAGVGNENRKNAHWWNNELTVAKSNTVAAWRRLKRARAKNRSPAETEIFKLDYKQKKAFFRALIFKAKNDAWKKLCAEVEGDPWGRPFKIISRLDKEIPPLLPSERVLEIIDDLFITTPLQDEPARLSCASDIPPLEVTMEELRVAIAKLKPKKAPGLDGLPLLVLRRLFFVAPELLLHIYNICVSRAYFPTLWKIQKLILLPKNKKDAQGRPVYRPISLLPVCAKLLEQIMLARLQAELDKLGGFSEHQFGFIKGRSTTDAIVEVIRFTELAKSRYRKAMIILVDIKNAFNMVRWATIVNKLVNKGFSPQIVKIVNSYFLDRKIVYIKEDSSLLVREVFAGVPQGSILGPFFWNVIFDDLIRMHNSLNVKFVAYADDLAILVSAYNQALMIKRAQAAYGTVHRWTNQNGLTIEMAKTEVMQLTGARGERMQVLSLMNVDVPVSLSVKYLGITLDSANTYRIHFNNMCLKANRALEKLNRILPNVGGATLVSRRMLMSIPKSMVLYAVPVFFYALRHRWARIEMRAIQRLAGIRICAAYRTVAWDVLDILAGILPVVLEAYKRKYKYLSSLADGKKELYFGFKNEAIKIPGVPSVPEEPNLANIEEELLAAWQKSWEESANGRWTFKLLPSIKSWLTRKAGNPNYYVTQFLSGHGCFGSYLYRIRRERTPECWFCGHSNDTAEHTFFECQFWNKEREKLEKEMNFCPTVVNIIPWATSNLVRWNVFYNFVKEILICKAKQERIRVLSGLR